MQHSVSRFALVAVGLLSIPLAASPLLAEELPIAIGGKDRVSARIEPAGDVDTFTVFLLAGDVLKVKQQETGPIRDLKSTLTVFDGNGVDVTPFVDRQGSFKPSFTLTAATEGLHVIQVAGAAIGAAGDDGHYQLSLNVKRAKLGKQVLDDPAGGAIALGFGASNGSKITINASTKKGGFDLTGIRGPTGDLEAGFDASHKAKGNRRGAKVKKLFVHGGSGQYTIEGNYDAGSAVKFKVKVKHPDKKNNRELLDLEPQVDPFFRPFPDEGITANPAAGLTGTLFTVSGKNFSFDPGEVDDEGNNITTADDIYPQFFIGGMEIPPADLLFNGAQYQFYIPEGLAVSTSHDLRVINEDGQGDLYEDAFFVVPPPRALLLSANEAGPAGGRQIQITGADFRAGSVALIDSLVVQPDRVRTTRIDVTLPPHAPGQVDLVIRDPFGQTSTMSGAITYLNRGTNDVTSISPTWLQGLGGQTITVTGVDFAADSKLTLDGQDLNATLVSSTEMTFVAPTYKSGTFVLEVRDSVDQANQINVDVRGFDDDTHNAIPLPITTANAVDGWRATTQLRGDLNGDGKIDLVMLRPEAAFGNDVNRSRLRILTGDGAGKFTDVTAASLPTFTGDEDGRAEAGVLGNFDGQNGLDIAFITRESIDNGNRSSLRILFNDGNGVFTDGTTASIPVGTSYGDDNQGLAIAAVKVDNNSSLDLVITHDERFVEVIVTPPPPPDPNNPPDPNDPPPEDMIETFYYAGTRVLLNNGSGVFTRSTSAMPAYDANAGHHYEGDTMVAADANNDGDIDLFITRDDPLEDPNNAGSYLMTGILLENNGSGVFTDVSSTRLPAASNPEFLQGDRVIFINNDADVAPELFILSDIRLVDPTTGTPTTSSALRVFDNDGSGTFSAPTTDPMPSADGSDSQQGRSFAIADLTGDGKLDIAYISSSPPNAGDRALRILIWTANGYVRGTAGLPNHIAGDNLRGQFVDLWDVDGDNDVDVVLSRSEADETVRNTRVLLNPLND